MEKVFGKAGLSPTVRRFRGTFFPLAPKLVFCNSNRSPFGLGSHQSNERFIWSYLYGTEAILIAVLENLWLNGIALRLVVPRGAEGA